MSGSDWHSHDFEDSDGDGRVPRGRRRRDAGEGRRARRRREEREERAHAPETEHYDSDEGGAGHEHPNEELDPGRPCRAPEDLPEWREQAIVDDFPSIFTVDANAEHDGIDLGREDLQHTWTTLTTLIEQNLARGTELAAIVDQVHEYYERCVRSSFADAPVWPKSSIARYILRNSPNSRERQCDAVIDSVFAIITLLRNNAASQHRETGEITPHSNNIKTLLGAAKTHAALVDARAKRLKSSQ